MPSAVIDLSQGQAGAGAEPRTDRHQGDLRGSRPGHRPDPLADRRAALHQRDPLLPGTPTGRHAGRHGLGEPGRELVPIARLHEVLHHPNDKPLLAALSHG